MPGKNILAIGGKPLVQWTIDAALASRHIDRVILSSDDEAIMRIAIEGGCEVPFRRDSSLATDEASSIDVVVDALNRLPGYDIIVLLQPTSPLRTGQDIDGVLQTLEATSAPACVTVREAHDHPYWTFCIRDGGRLEPFVLPSGGVPARRQDLPAAWCLNGAVYAAQVDWFLQNRTFLSPLTAGHPMPVDRSLDIDTPTDVELFRAAVER